MLHEDDAVDLGRDVAEVVCDEDETDSVVHEAAHGFAEVALGGEVECVGGLVEQKLAGAVDEGAGDENAALFSGGHFADGMIGKVRGVDAFEGFGGAQAHFIRDDEIGPERAGRKEAGEDGVESGGAGGVAAGRVWDAAVEGLQAGEVVGDDSEMFAELGEIPAGATEDGDFRAGLAGFAVVSGGGDDGVKLAGHGADEGGLAASIGAEDGDVFAGADGEIDVVEDDAVAECDVDVAHD